MVIDDFHVICAAVFPPEADAPLIVDTEAVLALTAAFQGFEPVGRRNPQVVKSRRIVEHAQLAPGHLLDIRRQSPGRHAAPDLLGFLVGEIADHGVS